VNRIPRYFKHPAIPLSLLFGLAGLLLVTFPLAACDGMKKQPLTCRYQMETQLPADTVVKREEQTDTIRLLKGNNLSATLESDPHFRELQSGSQAEDIALAFICAHHQLFRLTAPSDELVVASVTSDDLGLTHVKFSQVSNGIPVWASEIIVHLDRENNVYLVQGRYNPTPAHVNSRPRLSAPEAERIAAGNMGKPECPYCRTDKIIYPQPGAAAALAWRVEASAGRGESWTFIIHAETGAVLEKLSAVHTGRPPGM